MAAPVASLGGERQGDDAPASDLLHATFAALHAAEIRYCLLRPHEEVRGDGAGRREVDVLLAPNDLEPLACALRPLGFVERPSWGHSPHHFFVAYDEPADTWLKLDVVTALVYGAPIRHLPVAGAEGCLTRRVRRGPAYVAAPEDELATLLLHCLLDKRGFRAGDWARLAELGQCLANDAAGRERLDGAFGAVLGPALPIDGILGALARGERTWLLGRRAALTRQLFQRQPWNSVWRRATAYCLRRVGLLPLLQSRPGVATAVIAPDGAGKTTLARALTHDPVLRARAVYLGANAARRGHILGASRYLRRLGSRWWGYAVGYWHRRVGRFVAFDRYGYDAEVARRAPSLGRRWRRWLLRHACPTPDLVVVLDAPATVLLDRKRELIPAVLERQRAVFGRLATELPNAILVDATQNGSAVRRAVTAAIWRSYATGAPRPPSPPSPMAVPQPDTEADATPGDRGGDSTRKQLRGSSLLLAGRLISAGFNFVTQAIIARYLSTPDLGALAYAMSVVTLLSSIASLGLARGVTRFTPIYHERHDYDRLFGTIVLAVTAILATSLLAIGVLHAAPGLVGRLIHDEGQVVDLLLIMIFLVPVEAFNSLIIGLFASFVSPRAIFFRKHLLAPGLKFVVVLLLISLRASVVFVAYGYLVASVAGVVLFSWVLVRLLHREGVLRNFRVGTMVIPAKEVLAFTIPLLTSDLVTVVMHSADTLLLGYFHNVSEVARYRVVVPAAQLNMFVMEAFGLLYMPVTARLFARGDHQSIDHLYWQTAIWMTILAFPVFAVTFSTADSFTTFLYGSRYADSAIYMQLMTVGYYFNVVLGFNGLTLKVLGRLRYVVAINALAAVINVVLAFLLIPRYGALGAAIATAAALVAFNLLKQAGLLRASGVSLVKRQYLSIYGYTFAAAVILWLVQRATAMPFYIALPLAGAVSLVLLVVCKRSLRIADTFPELLRVPGLGALLR